jgi:DNA-binding IscR family transcriptional regulator
MIKTQFETAVVLLTLLAANPNTILNSLEMADRSGKNYGGVRRLMISLGDAGLVLSQRGSSGDWMLARDPKTITLEDIHRAVVRRPFIAELPKRSILRASQRLDRELRAVIEAASDTGLARLASVSLADIA